VRAPSAGHKQQSKKKQLAPGMPPDADISRRLRLALYAFALFCE